MPPEVVEKLCRTVISTLTGVRQNIETITTTSTSTPLRGTKRNSEIMTTPKINPPAKRSRVLFNSGGRNQKIRKSEFISRAIESLVESECSSVLDIISVIATNHYYKRNRELHHIFDSLA